MFAFSAGKHNRETIFLFYIILFSIWVPCSVQFCRWRNIALFAICIVVAPKSDSSWLHYASLHGENRKISFSKSLQLKYKARRNGWIQMEKPGEMWVKYWLARWRKEGNVTAYPVLNCRQVFGFKECNEVIFGCLPGDPFKLNSSTNQASEHFGDPIIEFKTVCLTWL